MLDARFPLVRHGAFPQTNWAVVAAAACGEDAARREAWAELCKLYWYPIYAFVRREWPLKKPEEACELTQEFFRLRLEKGDIQQADRRRGRFQDWVKSAAMNLARNRHQHEYAGRRDPRKLVYVEALSAEERLRLEPRTAADPERLLERDLALGVLERGCARLRREYEARGDAAFFRRACYLLDKGGSAGLPPLLDQSSEGGGGTWRAKVYRMRKRFEKLVDCDLEQLLPGADKCARRVWLKEALAVSRE